MNTPLQIFRKIKPVLSRLGSLILLFQKTPVVQMIFPQSQIAATAGVGQIAKWSVAVVAGLGAFDSVAGATTITQLQPSAGSTTVPATKGANLAFVFQMTGTQSAPKSWKVTGTLPQGLIHNATSGSIDSITGVPSQTGSFPITITGYEKTNFGGLSKSQAFTINVSGGTATGPTITAQPASISILSGNTATLSVTATGSPLTYQWYAGSSGVTTSPVQGATSASFTTPPLTSTTTYWVKVSNSAASTNSGAATVSVLGPPSITKQPSSSINILSGRSITLSVAATGSALKYQWYIGGTGNTTNPVSGATSASFTTPPLFVTTTYWVRVSNAAGKADSSPSKVTVIAPITITRQPASKTIKSGTSTTLSVAVSGSSPKYQWYIGSPGITNRLIVGATTATLNTGVLNANTTYWVRITNAAGFVNSKAATVTVGAAASVTSSGTLTLVPSGNTVTFNAVSAASAGLVGVLHYQLQSSADPDSGAWKPVAGFSDIIGDDLPRSYRIPPADAGMSYRIKTTLAP